MSSSPLVQIVDGDGQFVSDAAMKDAAAGLGLVPQTGLDYYVVAVLGSQSSGKSTLLNLLFGTKFVVRDGRTQTTQGIWAGANRCIAAADSSGGLGRPNLTATGGSEDGTQWDATGSQGKETILVLDVEGTDGAERGENSFERKTSLFSLALAEVLIVNMWHQSVGLFHGGNMSLLKNVLELNIQLFPQKPAKNRTLMLFVIRDYVEEESTVDALGEIIQKNLQDIWAELSLPKEMEGTKLKDLFDFQFTGLPHKFYRKPEFEAAAVKLRRRFEDHSDPEFVFAEQYKGDIPADALPLLFRNVWATIEGSEDVDLPTQKEMVAIYRCDEISTGVSEEFNKSVQILRADFGAEAEPIPRLGVRMSELLATALSSFDALTKRYHPSIVSKKRAELSLLLQSFLNDIFVKQIRVLNDRTNAALNSKFAALCGDGSKIIPKFSATCATLVTDVVQGYVTVAQGSVLSADDLDFEKWSFEEDYGRLVGTCVTKVDHARAQQVKACLAASVDSVDAQLGRWLQRALDNPSTKLWSDIRAKFEDAIEGVKVELDERLSADVGVGAALTVSVKEAVVSVEVSDVSKTAVAKAGEELTVAATRWLKEVFQAKAKNAGSVLERRFNTAFLNTEDGIPRRWKPTDDVNRIFLQARDQAEGALEQLAFLRLDPALDEVHYVPTRPAAAQDGEAGAPSTPKKATSGALRADKVPKDLLILTVEECEDIRDRFDVAVAAALATARNQQEQVFTKQHVPMWVVLLLLYTGFDELLHLLSHPTSLIMMLILGGIVFAVYKLGLISGPMQQAIDLMVHTNMHNFRQQVTDLLHKLEQGPSAFQQTKAKND